MVTLKGKYITEWDGGAWRTKALIKHWFTGKQCVVRVPLSHRVPPGGLFLIFDQFFYSFVKSEWNFLHHLYLINTHIQKKE